MLELHFLPLFLYMFFHGYQSLEFMRAVQVRLSRMVSIHPLLIRESRKYLSNMVEPEYIKNHSISPTVPWKSLENMYRRFMHVPKLISVWLSYFKKTLLLNEMPFHAKIILIFLWKLGKNVQKSNWTSLRSRALASIWVFGNTKDSQSKISSLLGHVEGQLQEIHLIKEKNFQLQW